MAETARPRLTRGETIAVSAVAWTLAAVLTFFGTSKLIAADAQVAAFQAWGYPLWMVYLVGATEVAAALLLLFPDTAFYGGTLALGVPVGAMSTLVVAGQYTQLPLPAVTAAAAGLVALLHRPTWLADRTARDGTSIAEGHA